MVIRPLPLWKYLSSLFLSLLRMMLTNFWIVDEGKTIKWGQNFDNLFVPATATPQVDVFCGQIKKSTSFCYLRGLLMVSKKQKERQSVDKHLIHLTITFQIPASYKSCLRLNIFCAYRFYILMLALLDCLVAVVLSQGALAPTWATTNIPSSICWVKLLYILWSLHYTSLTPVKVTLHAQYF